MHVHYISLSLVPVDGKRRVSLYPLRGSLYCWSVDTLCFLCLQKMTHLQSSDLPECRVRRERERGREGGRGRGREREGGRGREREGGRGREEKER